MEGVALSGSWVLEGRASGLPHPSHVVVQIQHACNLVAQRSARLLAVAVTAILEQTERATPVKSTTCSVDGGVFEHYLKYRKYLSSALGWMVGDANVDLIQFNQFRESSSRGAAYLAAAVHHHGQAHIG